MILNYNLIIILNKKYNKKFPLFFIIFRVDSFLCICPLSKIINLFFTFLQISLINSSNLSSKKKYIKLY
jgi:hypothetical protein